MDHGKLAGVMQTLALKAGAAIMEVYDSPDMGVEAKADDSPVTRADLAADQIISDGLRAAFPDVPLVTEEQAASHNQTVQTFLIVDPLDGTKEFVKRRGEFTVNIAYVENGVPLRGVVYAPAKGRLFATDCQGRAMEIAVTSTHEMTDSWSYISVATAEDGLNVVASKSHRDPATDDYINKYTVKDVKSAGSSLKFCLVATGEADLYPRLGRTMEWDTAAGDAVLRAAGGGMVRLDDHSTFTYGKPGFENPFFIAHGKGVNLQ